MVGDNPAWDIAPAKRLGMTAIWADRGNHSREEAGRSGADRMISALSELLPG
jgi:FMN phosphatase YigB (HAD superfamily)